MLGWAVWKHIWDDECVVQRIVRRGSMGRCSSDDVVVQRRMQCRILLSCGLDECFSNGVSRWQLQLVRRGSMHGVWCGSVRRDCRTDDEHVQRSV